MKRTSKNIDDLLLTVKNNTRKDVLLSEDRIHNMLSEAQTSPEILLVSKNYRAMYVTALILISGIILFSAYSYNSVQENNAHKNSSEIRTALIPSPAPTDVYPNKISPASHRGIEKPSVRMLNTKTDEKFEAPVQDNISSFPYISLSSQEFADLKSVVNPQAKEILSNKMIPVHIGSKAEKRSDVFFWYYPTKEFISALPERYRLSLEKELAVIDEAEKKNLCAGDVCRKLTAPSFFDYCRSQSGAIERSSLTTVSAQKKTIAELDLSESRTISVSVYDQSGKFISKIVTGLVVESGIQQVTIDLNGLSQGAYLLAITTEKGEQVIQRIIVQ